MNQANDYEERSLQLHLLLDEIEQRLRVRTQALKQIIDLYNDQRYDPELHGYEMMRIAREALR